MYITEKMKSPIMTTSNAKLSALEVFNLLGNRFFPLRVITPVAKIRASSRIVRLS